MAKSSYDSCSSNSSSTDHYKRQPGDIIRCDHFNSTYDGEMEVAGVQTGPTPIGDG